MKNITSGKVSLGFATTLLVLVINAVVAYQRIETVATNNRTAIASDNVLNIVVKTISTLKDVELGQREYLLTENPEYLAAHRIDIAQIRTQLNSLGDLKSAQGVPVPWQPQIERQLTELVETIDLRQARVLAPARQLELTQRGQQSIDRMREIFISLDRSERSQLDRLQRESLTSLTDTKVAFAIAGLLDLGLLTFLYGLVSWDFTRKNQAESTLRDYVADFEELYHSAPCGYFSVDATGKFLRINRTELAMLGYAEAELIGCKNIVDLLTSDSLQKLDDNFALLKTRGWISDIEFEMVCKDGRIVPVSATVVAINDASGNYFGARVTSIDISERLRLRQQARVSAEISQKIRQSLQLEEILHTAVEEVHKLLEVDRVLIFRLNPDGSGTIVQERVSADYPAIMGSNIIDPGFDCHDRHTPVRIYAIADITKASLDPCYIEFLQQFGVKASAIVPIYLRAELWGLLIVHHCQAPRQWQPQEVEIMSQLTTQIGIALTQAQLLAQEQLQRQELMRSNAELEQFAYIASHDLQEPLRMVISYLQLLSRRYQGKLDPDADEFIEYAVDGAVRMQALIQALLSYARVSSRKQPLSYVNCDLVLQDAISNLHVAITESEAVICAEPLPVVWGDATQLTQVFQNLIANAIKFRRDNIPPQIQIRAQPLDLLHGIAESGHERQGDGEMGRWGDGETGRSSITELKNYPLDRQRPLHLPRAHSSASIAQEPSANPTNWCFAVADNGIGIEPQYLDRIFVIFQRLHPRVTYPGTGIGLAICKKIIERHGGTIWVESKSTSLTSTLPQPLPLQPECSGSVFYFVLPAESGTSLQHDHKQPDR